MKLLLPALMLLIHSRIFPRTDERGDSVTLTEPDRSRWDHDLLAEGFRLVERVLVRGLVGPFQIRAAIAAGADLRLAHHQLS